MDPKSKSLIDLNDPRLEGVIIRITDIRRCGICSPATRRWFATKGFDFRDFLKNGIPASKLVETGDGHALRAVTAKIERDGG